MVAADPRVPFHSGFQSSPPQSLHAPMPAPSPTTSMSVPFAVIPRPAKLVMSQFALRRITRAVRWWLRPTTTLAAPQQSFGGSSPNTLVYSRGRRCVCFPTEVVAHPGISKDDFPGMAETDLVVGRRALEIRPLKGSCARSLEVSSRGGV